MSEHRPRIPRRARTWMAIAMLVEMNIILLLLALRPALADVKLFEIIAQAVVIQGVLGLLLPFYFGSNEQGDGQ